MTTTRDDRLTAALATCADEPIRIPGSIQPHGVLLGLENATMRVLVASDNTGELLDVDSDPSGLAIEDLLPSASETIRAAAMGDLREANPVELSAGTSRYTALLHRTDGLLIAELEPAGAGESVDVPGTWQRALPSTLQLMQDAESLDELISVLAREVRYLTGFDRVMIYRFDADWNGEVVAEARAEDLEPFLGLHYPASDIPAQARALYTAHWLRIIPNVHYRPSPLVPQTNPLTGAPLDLSAAVLRSVSPVHLEYLRNMGVAASMSVSLVDRGRLWGLIACHHYRGPRRPRHAVRAAAEFLGRTASLLLATKQGREGLQSMVVVGGVQARLTEALAQNPGAPVSALTEGPATIADLLPDASVVVRIGGRLWMRGDVPAPPQLERVLTVLAARMGDRPVATSSLARLSPELADLAAQASGVLAVPVAGAARGDLLLWLRPEILREVTWGGSPAGGTVIDDDATGPRLSPRRSFARWGETVRQTARPWLPHEVEAAVQLGRLVSESLLRRVESDARLVATLQRTVLLEALPAISGLGVAARYLPSQQDVTGGDWYDVVPLPSGQVAFALGDVAGHGLTVTAIGAQLRHGMRAYLLRDEGPAAALQATNRLVISLLPDEFATAVVVVVDPATGAVRLASAGHPPVLRLGATGAGYLSHRPGPPLGFGPESSYDIDEMLLAPGDGLLLFSDGLVERRGATIDSGLTALARLVGGLVDLDLESLCDRVITQSRSLVDGGSVDDDITILAIRRDPPD